MGFGEAFGYVTGSASLLGLAVAFVKLRKVRGIAETAEATARRVERRLQQRSVLSEVTACGQAVNDARSYIRLGQAHLALFKVENLASRLSTIRKLDWFLNPERGAELGQALRNAALVRTALDQHACASGAQAYNSEDASLWIKRLGTVEDQVNEWIGELRYSREERLS